MEVVAGATGPSLTAADRAYAVIRAAILEGRFAPGHPLREEELAESVGVSRTPVREAFRRLDAEGLVELLAHRGARVVSWSDHDLDEIFELRVQLEGHGARLAAQRAEPELIDHLERLAARMEEEVAGRRRDRFARITDINNEFHQTILSASGNHRLSSLLGVIVQRGLVARTFQLYRPEQLERSCRQHRELIEALRLRDPDWAEAAMRAHLYAGRHAAQGVAR